MCQNLFTWRVVPDRKITLDLVPNVHNERGQLLPQSAEKTFKVLRILNMPWLVPGRRVKQCLEGKTKLTLPTFKASDSPSNVTLVPKPTNLYNQFAAAKRSPFTFDYLEIKIVSMWTWVWPWLLGGAFLSSLSSSRMDFVYTRSPHHGALKNFLKANAWQQSHCAPMEQLILTIPKPTTYSLYHLLSFWIFIMGESAVVECWPTFQYIIA